MKNEEVEHQEEEGGGWTYEKKDEVEQCKEGLG